MNGGFTCVCTDRSMEQIAEVRAAQQEKLGLRGQTLFVYMCAQIFHVLMHAVTP